MMSMWCLILQIAPSNHYDTLLTLAITAFVVLFVVYMSKRRTPRDKSNQPVINNNQTQNPKNQFKGDTPSQSNKLTKRCPYCGEVILAKAIKCKFCGEWIKAEPNRISNTPLK